MIPNGQLDERKKDKTKKKKTQLSNDSQQKHVLNVVSCLIDCRYNGYTLSDIMHVCLPLSLLVSLS